jgi:hypothetical protein
MEIKIKFRDVLEKVVLQNYSEEGLQQVEIIRLLPMTCS